jgi:prepilin-type N-terminal cleavage/methylation domain-containing protein
MKQQKSFTLIEILVVIVVIGVLSAFILVGMSSITNSANVAKSKAFLNSMDNSLLLARVSQWKLDETGVTTSATDSWGINTGTWSGAGGGSYTSPSWRTSSECISNGCLAFDGTDDFVDCGNNDSLKMGSNNFSISLWFKLNQSSNQSLITKGYSWAGAPYNNLGWAISIYSVTGKIWFDTYKTGQRAQVVSNKSFTVDNQWYNLVVLKYGTSATTYINGIFDNLGVAVDIVEDSTVSVKIGKNSGVEYYFKGLIDDVRIYNQAIPASEIQQNYYIGLNKLLLNNGIGNIEYKNRLALSE